MAQGVVFGNYLLLGRLSRGGMAEVFLGKSLEVGHTDQLYAIKRTLPHFARDRDFATMFVDEATIARDLRHPNICAIHDQGEHEDQLYIVMEFIHGKDLRVVQHRSRERREPIPYRYIAYTIARIAAAIDYAHKKTNANGELEGIVHRDVSPQNILISYEGVPKLIDFGIAKAKSRLARTQVGIVKGKLAYMSPEQVSGGEIDFRTDIFALGVVLYELTTGRAAFRGSSDYSTLQRITSGRYTPPIEVNPEVPPALAAVIARALATKPEDRYASAADMAMELDIYVARGERSLTGTALSAFMRKLFREDYIREATRIKTYVGMDVPTHGERRGTQPFKSGGQNEAVSDATGVAPSFIRPEGDSPEPPSAERESPPRPMPTSAVAAKAVEPAVDTTAARPSSEVALDSAKTLRKQAVLPPKEQHRLFTTRETIVLVVAALLGAGVVTSTYFYLQGMLGPFSYLKLPF